jgi:hypothetical protein
MEWKGPGTNKKRDEVNILGIYLKGIRKLQNNIGRVIVQAKIRTRNLFSHGKMMGENVSSCAI